MTGFLAKVTNVNKTVILQKENKKGDSTLSAMTLQTYCIFAKVMFIALFASGSVTLTLKTF